MWIQHVPDDAAQGELRQLYDRSRDPESNRVDAILAVHSLQPAGLRAHLQLYEYAMASTAGLRRADRELIAVVTSAINECEY